MTWPFYNPLAKLVAVRAYLVLLILGVLTVVPFWKTTSDKPFYYDESDYMYAGTRGFIANYLDQPSISPLEFVQKGLELYRDKTKRGNISEFVRKSGDITFYRHYHGPVYACWIALWHALGAVDNGTYRASGLILHLLSVTLIFWIVRLAFPELPVAAALVAGASLLLNRTALVAATMITQHEIFSVIAGVTLLLAALYFAKPQKWLWYAACAALGVSFATVESSFILVLVFLFLLAIVGLQQGWKQVPGMFGKGLLSFVLAILVVWPKGVLQLGALKGYGYLAYIAIARKTFNPISPGQLWTSKFTTYPEEFIVPAVALLIAAILWKRTPNRQALIPFVSYAVMFILVTMVVTAPYTYYHVSLLATTAVITGVVFGTVWRRSTSVVRVLASAAIAIPLLWMPVRYYRETLDVQSQPDSRRELLAWLTAGHGKSLVLPYILVPTVHYYHTESSTIPYDKDAAPADLANNLTGGANRVLLCEQAVCQAVRAQVPNTFQSEAPVMGDAPGIQTGPLYAVALQPGL